MIASVRHEVQQSCVPAYAMRAGVGDRDRQACPYRVINSLDQSMRLSICGARNMQWGFNGERGLCCLLPLGWARWGHYHEGKQGQKRWELPTVPVTRVVQR